MSNVFSVILNVISSLCHLDIFYFLLAGFSIFCVIQLIRIAVYN